MTMAETVRMQKLAAEVERLAKRDTMLDLPAIHAALTRLDGIDEALKTLQEQRARDASALQGLLAGLHGPREPMPEVPPPKSLVDHGIVDPMPERKARTRRSLESEENAG